MDDEKRGETFGPAPELLAKVRKWTPVPYFLRNGRGPLKGPGVVQGQITEPLLEIHQYGTVTIGLRVVHVSSATSGGAGAHKHRCVGKHCILTTIRW